MDGDRLAPIDSTWNNWLIAEAVKLTMELLKGDLLHLFGADAYLCLRPRGEARPSSFANALAAELRSTPCWPVRNGSSKTVDHRNANQIVVPITPALDSLLSDERYLDSRLFGVEQANALALECGAQRFTINSLIRLRCAGQDGTRLKTKPKPKEEANYWFTDHNTALRDMDRQVKMAKALTEVTRRLSVQNREDLRETASTLAADGAVRKASELIAVDPSIEEASVVQAFERLHPSLFGFDLIAGMCRPFSIDGWIIGIIHRLNSDEATDEERETLYRYLLEHGPTLKQRTLFRIRHASVVRNHRGEWVKPSALVSKRMRFFSVLEPVLSAPAPELENAKAFLERIRLRTTLNAEDILAFAKHVGNHPELSETFEGILVRAKKLLTPKLVNQLCQIPFLRSSTGELAAPIKLHLRTAENLACLDSEDGFVRELNPNLYRALRCAASPSSATLLVAIGRWHGQASGPKRPEALYPALVEALHRDRVSRNIHKDAAILWVDGSYQKPDAVLVGAAIPRCFDTLLPVIRSPEILLNTYAALGAHPRPTDGDWVQFFTAFGKRHADEVLAPGTDGRRAILLAYRARGAAGIPEGFPETIKFLLARDGTLHSLADLKAGRFLEDDYPELSEAADRDDAGLAFAELTDATRDFLAALGLRRLSAVSHAGTPQIGPARKPPLWFREEHQHRLIRKFRHSPFASAVLALARVEARRGTHIELPSERELKARLDKAETIDFVHDIRRPYRIGNIEVTISVEEAFAGNQFAIVFAASLYDLNHLLAYALAEVLGAVRIERKRSLGLVILPLIQCRDTEEMAVLLRRQGISWNVKQQAQADTPRLGDDSVEVGTEDAIEGMVRQVVDGLVLSGAGQQAIDASRAEGSTPNSASGENTGDAGETADDHDEELPPISNVTLNIVGNDSSWLPPAPSSSGSRRSGAWTPPTGRRVERDQQVGRRGEELVYRHELERVRALGHPNPEQVVIWTSASDPGADHDIRSLAEDGRPLWIEVKSTVGTDGYFEWPKNEFQKALREGDHHELCRVYEVASEHPVVKRFRNPAELVGAGRLRLDLGTLRAIVEPMGATVSAGTADVLGSLDAAKVGSDDHKSAALPE
jgi:hypothetical protein